jgi:hypothetical protein
MEGPAGERRNGTPQTVQDIAFVYFADFGSEVLGPSRRSEICDSFDCWLGVCFRLTGDWFCEGHG